MRDASSNRETAPSSPPRYSLAAIMVAIAAALMVGLHSGPAQALPSFARQTGQQCAACHNGFPELTPYGRLFKLNGFTFTGGQSDLPPVAAMEVNSFTHTQAPQYGGAATHYAANDNFAVDGGSLFYGGAIASDLGLGAFAQMTYDHIGNAASWDNTDIRWAHATTLLDSEIVYGVSLNNNPTVTDLWNTTPAWSFPFVASGLAPGPAASTLIEGGLAQQVVGLDAYTFWNRLIYLEAGAYRSLSIFGDKVVGVAASGTNSIDTAAPYWRAAIEPHWGRNTWEIGTFGLEAPMNPSRVTGFGTDDFTDIGFDTQYQFLSDRHSVSVQASYITEQQTLNSSFAQGNASNRHDNLDSFHIKTSYYYDQTYGATLGFFRVTGSRDSGLYSSSSATNSPNSAGWTAEIDYMPFDHGGPDFWPWLNMKIGLQYVYYVEFNGGTNNYDGSGHNAGDNNTTFAFVWFAF
jgi:hypothetical protein